jgi:RNA polymerase sigma-70 factor, ECF subfamily
METSATLLERLRGDSEPTAWRRFVDLYTPILFAFARRLGLNENDAADLVQEAFVLLLVKLPGFRYDGRRSFRAWLWTIMRNKAATSRRGPQMRAAEIPELTVASEIEQISEDEYRALLVGRAMEIMQSEFEPTTWKAAWEHTVSDRSAAEVAAELGISVGAVYAAKFRVLTRLRHELRDLLD